ncbi:hypothetical protein R3P38DRAFT_3175037 [Favolaschia claudopus]|uniref:Uncharacterized protein n=1 Tax=Favolaschia claudopus TaxID=2862362 RepID=A0AAW0D954_9AGAR
MVLLIPQCVFANFQLTRNNHPDLGMKEFTALQYPTAGDAQWVNIPTICDTIAFSTPCVDSCFTHLDIELWTPTRNPFNQYPLHTTLVSIDEIFPSGEVKTTKFVCIFLRHKNLPRNERLNVRGDIIVMRTEADGRMVAHLNKWESELANQAIERYNVSPQESNVSCIEPIVFSINRYPLVASEWHPLTASEWRIATKLGGGRTNGDNLDDSELGRARDRRGSKPALLPVPRFRELASKVDGELADAGWLTSGPIIGRLYGQDDVPRLVLVDTVTPNSHYRRRYPILDPHMTPLEHRHEVIDILVLVTHSDQGGSATRTDFRCYFRCCSSLPLSPYLRVRGEVIIMRMAHDRVFELDDLRLADYKLADHVANVLAPKLREYQEQGTLILPFSTVFPGTLEVVE